MKKIALALSLALSTLAAPAFAQQSTTDVVLSDSLASITKVFGDGNGHLTTTEPTGATRILAYGTGRFIVYTGGDDISTSDTLALCIEDQAGGLSSCTPPGSTGYTCEKHCGSSGCDGWCECSGVVDCIAMAYWACSAPATCQGNECACEH